MIKKHYFVIVELFGDHLTKIVLQAKLETKALKAKRPGFTDDRYAETSYYVENGKIKRAFILYNN